eukprot:CAMPEP_0118948762 /NCGR_PEP_ID=MMETSP1169-20130426/48393_1 /TAXON_ID=36882 /ORGANISM="Pyramimonas obovata, Strain CCMP722" /LENGTH=62 /DNA_ID=CAMNT_0006895267 /DNA_START=127 /DNA_END=312 /DNA_ORIENTATION=-
MPHALTNTGCARAEASPFRSPTATSASARSCSSASRTSRLLSRIDCRTFTRIAATLASAAAA